jgi:hypothetical protein
MAKVRSLFNVEGTLGEVTFYKDKDGYRIRGKSGVSRERILNDPQFARTRENLSEFSNSAKSGKQLRKAISGLMLNAKDGRVTSRVTKVMSQVKNSDLTSVAGLRNVATGIQTAAGKTWLRGFNFNVDAPLDAVLRTYWNLDTLTGEITIASLIPSEQISTPEGATHVTLSAAFLNLDFATEAVDLQLTNEVNLPITGTATSVTLTPTAAPVGTGQSFYFLKIAFFREINGIQSPLKNGAFNALQLLEVL